MLYRGNNANSLKSANSAVLPGTSAGLCRLFCRQRFWLRWDEEQSFSPAFAVFHICAALDPHTDLGGIVTAKKTPRRKEAHQMPSPRWLARLTIPIMAGAALITGAASAGANPTDDAYLAQLQGLGFTWPPGHEEALIGMAYLICDDLGWGWTPDQIAQQVHANLDPDSVGLGQVGSMVNLAHSTYCPNQRCWAAHC